MRAPRLLRRGRWVQPLPLLQVRAAYARGRDTPLLQARGRKGAAGVGDGLRQQIG